MKSYCTRCGKPTKVGRCHSCAIYSSNGISRKRVFIRSIIGESPWLTLQEGGDKVGVSREYVRQVVVMDGLERVNQVRRRDERLRLGQGKEHLPMQGQST